MSPRPPTGTTADTPAAVVPPPGSWREAADRVSRDIETWFLRTREAS